MRKPFPILALLAAALPCRATLLDFEELVGEENVQVIYYGPVFSTHGFDFVHTGDASLVNLGLYSFKEISGGNYTGSVAIVPNGAFTVPTSVTLSASGGGAFDLEAIDLANEARESSPAPQGATVRFVGTKTNGSTVTRSYTLSVGDGLETVAFSGFTGLTSVTFDQPYPFIQFDNVRVSAVPEPASLAALGIGALAFLRRRRA